MSQSPQKERGSIGPVVGTVLLMDGIAFAGLLVAISIGAATGSLRDDSRQALIMCLVALVLLSILLGGLAWTRSGTLTKAILGGLLCGLSTTINLALALALFDYGMAGSVEIALRILPIIALAAPVAAVVGLLAGLVVGAGAVLANWWRARRQGPATGDDAEVHARSRRKRLRQVATWTLLAAVVGVLALPLSYELRRRHAVMSIRAAGGKVVIRRPDTTQGWRSWLLRLGLTWDADLPLYSLESVSSIDVSEKATDTHLAYVACVGESLRSLRLGDSNITDAGLEHLSRLPSLRVLALNNTPITDEGLRHLAGLTTLEVLHANRTRITDEGLRHLAGLTKLQVLHASGTKITDEGLPHLSALIRLSDLTLDDTAINGPGISHLAALQGLRGLSLRGLHLRQPGLRNLSQLTGLWAVDLSRTNFEESTFRELSQLDNVQLINLSETNVIDAWLVHLRGLDNGRVVIRMENTEVSDEAVQDLQKLLPWAAIIATRRSSASP